MEKEVVITWEDKPYKVIMQEITWKQKKDSILKSRKPVQRGRKLVEEPDAILQREYMMLFSMQNPPEGFTVASFNLLKAKEGDKIYEAYAALNEWEEDDESGEALSESSSTVETSQK
jgi:hypothetical protein